MTLVVPIPGAADLELEHVVLDVNGTLTDRGRLIDGVAERLAIVRPLLALHILSADTYGNAEDIASGAGATFRRVVHGDEKRAYIEQLGAARTAAVGNGANDAPMLAVAGVAIAVLGPEGANAAALAAADIVAPSIAVALDLLCDPRAMTATLRQ
jgi:P-type E1-E2 ATPase